MKKLADFITGNEKLMNAIQKAEDIGLKNYGLGLMTEWQRNELLQLNKIIVEEGVDAVKLDITGFPAWNGILPRPQIETAKNAVYGW